MRWLPQITTDCFLDSHCEQLKVGYIWNIAAKITSTGINRWLQLFILHLYTVDGSNLRSIITRAVSVNTLITIDSKAAINVLFFSIACYYFVPLKHPWSNHQNSFLLRAETRQRYASEWLIFLFCCLPSPHVQVKKTDTILSTVHYYGSDKQSS